MCVFGFENYFKWNLSSELIWLDNIHIKSSLYKLRTRNGIIIIIMSILQIYLLKYLRQYRIYLFKNDISMLNDAELGRLN